MSVKEEYKDDARRIEKKYINPESETDDEVKADLEDADFAQASIDEIKEWMLTREDVPLNETNAHRDGVTTREEVQREVEDADDVGFSTDRRESITTEVSREIGAPTESDLQRAEIQMVSQETVTPGDVIEGDTRSSQISVVRNQQGEPVATIGGAGSSGRDVAEELGAEHYSSPQEYTDDLSAKPAPDGRRALLYSGGEAVGEVDL